VVWANFWGWPEQESAGKVPPGLGSPYYQLNAPHRRTHILLSAVFEPGQSPAAASGVAAAARRGAWSPVETFSSQSGSGSDSDEGGGATGEADVVVAADAPPLPGTWC
jgi:hypothetical protein